MSRYTTEERIFIVESYFRLNESISETQREFRRNFNTRNSPTPNAIKAMVARFHEQGSVCDLPKSGRPRTARSDENRQRLAESVAEDPSTSVRRRSSQIGVSRSSLHRMLHEEGKFPYKIQLVQELQPNDQERTGLIRI